MGCCLLTPGLGIHCTIPQMCWSCPCNKRSVEFFLAMKQRKQRRKVQKTKKEIIELERYRKRKILSKYAKLCAAEGIESARIKPNNSMGDVPQQTRQQKPVKKVPHPTTPVVHQERKDIEKSVTLKREKSHSRSHRTAKGQPVMKKQISLLLSKLENQ
jgi:hypothetical protein